MEQKAQMQVNELRDLVKRSRGIRLDDMAEIVATAEKQGGELVAVTGVDPDGDWCGNGRIRIKWPPKGTLGPLIDLILNKGIGGGIIINGTPHPYEVVINLSKGGQ